MLCSQFALFGKQPQYTTNWAAFYKSFVLKQQRIQRPSCTRSIDVTAIRLQETVSLDTVPKPRSTMHGLRSRPCFVDHCGKLSSTMAKATPSRKNDFYAIQTSQKDAEDNDENPQCMTSFSRPKPFKLGQLNIKISNIGLPLSLTATTCMLSA